MKQEPPDGFIPRNRLKEIFPRVSNSTLQTWTGNGTIKATLIGGRWFIRESEYRRLAKMDAPPVVGIPAHIQEEAKRLGII